MGHAQTPAQNEPIVPVTAENFTRAETELYFDSVVKKNGFVRFEHSRTPLAIDDQKVIRMNRDTMYSSTTRAVTP